MKAFQNAGGHVGLSARPYPIAADTAIAAGTVVKIEKGLVVKVGTKENSPILGIAAESHSGQVDAFDIRSNGEELLVYDNPELIFECAAPEMTVAKGKGSTMVLKDISAAFPDDAFAGGKVQLKSKVSGNTDNVNATRVVKEYTAEGRVFTLAAGGTPGAGDVYWVYPPIGSIIGALDETASRLVLSDTGAALRVVGHDIARHRLRLKAAKHSLNTEY